MPVELLDLQQRRRDEGAAHAGGVGPGSRVLVLGLSYKAGTSDWRESPSISVVERLLALLESDRVDFKIVSGPNAVADATGDLECTLVSNTCSVTYASNGNAGTDLICAWNDLDASAIPLLYTPIERAALVLHGRGRRVALDQAAVRRLLGDSSLIPQENQSAGVDAEIRAALYQLLTDQPIPALSRLQWLSTSPTALGSSAAMVDEFGEIMRLPELIAAFWAVALAVQALLGDGADFVDGLAAGFGADDAEQALVRAFEVGDLRLAGVHDVEPTGGDLHRERPNIGGREVDADTGGLRLGPRQLDLSFADVDGEHPSPEDSEREALLARRAGEFSGRPGGPPRGG